MIQDSWVWVAWVSRAIDGMATLREATADTTVASASMMTGKRRPVHARLSSLLGDGGHGEPPSGGSLMVGAGRRATRRKAGSLAIAGLCRLPALRSSSSPPSRSMVGSRRSSQAGSHQARCPSRLIAAGTSTIRTRVTSRRTASGQADTEHLRGDVAHQDEGAEDGDHDQAALVMTRAGGADALDDRALRGRRAAGTARGPG